MKNFCKKYENCHQCASNSESNGSQNLTQIVVLGSRGGAYEQIVPEI